MKKTKLVMLSIVLFAFCCLYATKPIEKNNEKFVNSFISKLSVEVTLTDSQKAKIMKQAFDYTIRMDTISKTINENTKTMLRVSASTHFELSIDSLLTQEQKSILESNRIQKLNLTSNKYQSKK